MVKSAVVVANPTYTPVIHPAQPFQTFNSRMPHPGPSIPPSVPRPSTIPAEQSEQSRPAAADAAGCVDQAGAVAW
ncbi:hypothetical protein QFC22_004314 [Naganishia vaughanmartiniae]|uniref:Uncharacterized protein n=1 Tax=Naganishia vaughanmartiniae TaxID=1424756 RepID=A0ACC2X2A6_9TREE|nr:hypothetical protein QFC22_004314 [Naganishia vaughanmartiniae]